MELIKITKNSRDIKKVKSLYKKAFPIYERIPFSILSNRTEKEAVELWGAYDASEWIGFAYVITDSEIAYLYYFAIEESKRSMGYGKSIIKALLDKYMNKRLFLALEPLNDKAKNKIQREKRHIFYERCGLHDLPHSITEQGVTFAVMGSGEKVNPEEYNSLMLNYIGRFWKSFFGLNMN